MEASSGEGTAPQNTSRFSPGAIVASLVLVVVVFVVVLAVVNSARAVREDDGRLLRVSRAEFGDRWPFTVEKGVLMCPSGSLYFKPENGLADGKLYGLNAAARRFDESIVGMPDITDVLTHGAFTPVERLAISERRIVFKALRECESDAACANNVYALREVNPDEATHIIEEGIASGWPPLTRAELAPILAHASALCEAEKLKATDNVVMTDDLIRVRRPSDP